MAPPTCVAMVDNSASSSGRYRRDRLCWTLMTPTTSCLVVIGTETNA